VIDLNDMRLFARVVEAGSFSAAARGLRMPKSTLSRRIARLEQALDTRLLQRTTRALHLTEPGAAFYERCSRVVAEAEEAERSLSMDRDLPQGLLRVTAPVEVGNAVLGALVAEYLAEYPRGSVAGLQYGGAAGRRLAVAGVRLTGLSRRAVCTADPGGPERACQSDLWKPGRGACQL